MNKKVCEKCGFENPEGMKFCGNCGNQFPQEINIDYSLNNQAQHDTTDKFYDVQEIKKLEPYYKDGGSIIIPQETNNEVQTIEDINLEKKMEVIHKKSANHKNKKKKNNKFLSYFLLIEAFTLLLIIIFYSLNEFVLIPFIHYVLTSLVMTIAFGLVYRDKEIGCYLAIISAVSMICMLYERDYISSVIGVYLFTSSFVYLIKR